MFSVALPNAVAEVLSPLEKRARVDRLRLQLKDCHVDLLLPALPSVECSLPSLRILFPAGIELGSFIEIIQAPGHGAISLAFALSATALAKRPAWAVLDSESQVYAQGIQLSHLDIRHLILLRPPPVHDGWVFSQLMRSSEIGVCFWNSPNLDNMLFRRIQLAAEKGGGLGFCIRPAAALRKPCWGSARLSVHRLSENRFEVSLLYARKRQLAEPLKAVVEL